MSQNTHRLIFNRSRGCLMAVSEAASSGSKRVSGTYVQPKGCHFLIYFKTSQSSQFTASNNPLAQWIRAQAAPDLIVFLDSTDNQVSLQAASNTSSQKTTNSSSSGSIGLSLSAQGLSATASASKGKGKSDGQDTSYTNTQITAGNTASIKSGADTAIKGAVVAANQIKADIGGNLTIESLRDTNTYNSSQKSSGFSLSVPITGGDFGASVSASKSKVDSNFQSVNEQSGLKAGDGGFQVSVANNTALTGGVIASTDSAVNNNKNKLTTGSLTASDLQNSSSASVQSSGINLNSDMFTQGKYGLAKAAITNGLNSSSTSASESGQTKSAVSGGLVTITDESKQLAVSGQTSQQALSGLNRDTNNTNKVVQKQDVQAKLKRVEADRAITQAAVKATLAFSDQAYKAMFAEQPKFYKITCPADANCTVNPEKAVTSPATNDEIQAAADKNTVLAVNGILNPLDRAGQLAMQNAPMVRDVDGTEGKPSTVYLMHYKPADNVISELMVAFYEKSMAPTMGYTNQDKAYADAIKSRDQQDTVSLGHSRGTIVQTNANTILAEQGYTNPNLIVRGVGGAVTAQEFTDAAVRITGEKQKDQISFNYFNNDPVPVVAGSNPGVISLSEFYKVLGTPNSAHSCYGTGAAGCAQVEILTPNAPPKATQNNDNLIRFIGGQQVDIQGMPIINPKK